MNWTILLVAHGTVSDLAELPAFIAEIRRGRPAPPELLAELRHRYETIGSSPLLRHTKDLAQAVEARTNVPTRVAMRLWEPRVSEVLADCGPDDHVVLVPLAPFSVPVYVDAAARALAPRRDAPALHPVPPWGREVALLEAWARGVRSLDPEEGREGRSVVLTAHSLPRAVIDRGDPYAREFEATARRVTELLGRPTRVAYQSQGAVDGEWLGPSLPEVLAEERDRGAREILIAPLGFLAEHVETLYDLDIEARGWVESWGLGFSRAPTLNTDPGLVGTIAELARRVMDAHAAGAPAQGRAGS